MIDPSRFLMNGCCFSIFCENAKSHTGAFSCSDYIPFGAFWQAEPDRRHFGHNSKRPLPGRGKERLIFFYSAALIFSIISAYCASVSFVWPGFMANTPPHSKPSLYFGTRWTCRWQPVSPYAP